MPDAKIQLSTNYKISQQVPWYLVIQLISKLCWNTTPVVAAVTLHPAVFFLFYIII